MVRSDVSPISVEESSSNSFESSSVLSEFTCANLALFFILFVPSCNCSDESGSSLVSGSFEVPLSSSTSLLLDLLFAFFEGIDSAPLSAERSFLASTEPFVVSEAPSSASSARSLIRFFFLAVDVSATCSSESSSRSDNNLFFFCFFETGALSSPNASFSASLNSGLALFFFVDFSILLSEESLFKSIASSSLVDPGFAFFAFTANSSLSFLPALFVTS